MAKNQLPLVAREPVRFVGYITALITLAAGITKQVVDTWDEGTGWLGLALATVVVIATNLQRTAVTPVAKVEQLGISQEQLKRVR